MEESKFNFSEDEANAAEENSRQTSQDPKSLMQSISKYFHDLLGFREDTDRKATEDAIKGDIPFRGATAWILICSIFVCSVGLNANSTAVVIGAMLISPLMGPILGIGFSIAINDIDTLRKSLSNFLVMVILSVLTAYLFFELFPLSEDSSELLGRTRPDIRDVLIAFFGGLALIIARTKKGTIATVIFGVAIATALMPPLCTVGYGLAKGLEPGLTEGSNGYTYALGAMYLFTINAIFIALATFIVLKVLRFPMLKYANSQKRKFIARIATLIAIIIMIPAGITFFNVYNESKERNQVGEFIKNKIRKNDAYQVLSIDVDYKLDSIYLRTFNEVSEGLQLDLNNDLKNNPLYPNLRNYGVAIPGSDISSYDLISKAYEDSREELKQSRNVVSGLQKEIEDLESEISDLNYRIEQKEQSTLAVSELGSQAKIRFPELEYFSLAQTLEYKDFVQVDTTATATVTWRESLIDSLVISKEKDLSIWLKGELDTDTVYVQRRN